MSAANDSAEHEVPIARAGRARIFAFVCGWSIDSEAPADLRALRGLLRDGAELTIFSAGGVWSFHGRDEVEQRAAYREGLRDDGGMFHASHHPGGDAVYVLDRGSFVRVAHPATQSVATTIAQAITASSEARRRLNREQAIENFGHGIGRLRPANE